MLSRRCAVVIADTRPGLVSSMRMAAFYLGRRIPKDRMLVFSSLANAEAAYESYFWRHDIWKAEAALYGLVDSGAIFHGGQFIARRAFQNTEFTVISSNP